MPTLGDVVSHLHESAHTYSTDLAAVNEFINELETPIAAISADVYVNAAVIQLRNSADYPVGHLTWDVDGQAFTFVPSDGKDS
jgi:hypothetical protein